MAQTETTPDAMHDPSGRKLIKISRDGGDWDFAWSQGAEKRTLKSSDRANPELPDELNAFLVHALAVAPYLDKKFHDKAVVATIKFSYKNDLRKAMAILSVNTGASEFVKIPTPKKIANIALDKPAKDRFETNAVTQLDKIVEQAFAYIDGERSGCNSGFRFA